MIVKLPSGLALSTLRSDAEERFVRGLYREATTEECVEALRSIPLDEISASPGGFRLLAVAIAGHSAFVGTI